MEESSVWGFYGLLRAVSYDDAGSFADRLLVEWLLWRHYHSDGGVCRHGRPGADYGMHRGFSDFGRVAFGGVALQRKGYALSVYFISHGQWFSIVSAIAGVYFLRRIMKNILAEGSKKKESDKQRKRRR